jgi:hypothetical protein
MRAADQDSSVHNALQGFTGRCLAMFFDSLVQENCPVVRIDVRGEPGFVHVEFSNGAVLCYGHDSDVPADLLESLYAATAAKTGLLDVPRH